jgi:hypothetical protein
VRFGGELLTDLEARNFSRSVERLRERGLQLQRQSSRSNRHAA